MAAVQTELATRIRGLTDNGEEMLAYYVKLMRDATIDDKYRLIAAGWLSDRLWGKEPAIIHLNAGGIFETLIHASDDELLAYTRGELGLTLPKDIRRAADEETGETIDANWKESPSG